MPAYRSSRALPNVLAPPDWSVLGFDPDAAQTQNLSTQSPNQPPPNPIPPPPINGNAAMASNIKLPSLSPRPTPSMPPPEIGSMDKQVASNSSPVSAPVSAAPTAAPIAPAQPAPAAPAPTPTQRLEQLKSSEIGQAAQTAPTNNWAQRLGLAILSVTRLAPVANQIIHPKWASQRAAFEQSEADIAAQAKIQEAEENIAGLTEQRQATAEQRRAMGLQRMQQADPHFGKARIDPSYAPAIIPDENGEVWVDKGVAANLTKPEKASKLTIVPKDSNVIDEDGKVIYTAPEKVVKPTPTGLTGSERVAARAAGVDPDNPQGWTQGDAQKVQTELARQSLASRPVVINQGVEDKRAQRAAMNAAFQAAGGDWNKVMDNARAGKVDPNYATDIFDQAEKMTKLPGDAQRRVASADATSDQVNTAVQAIDEFTKSHPDLVGSGFADPVTGIKRWIETKTGTEPPEIGAVDAALESAAALQPGQHNFRSVQALSEFKKALGIDPRTGKADGSRAWLVNPAKAKSALKSVADFNQRLKQDIQRTGGQIPTGPPAGTKRDPLGIR